MFKLKSSFASYHEHFNTMIDELDRANAIITEFLSLAKDRAVEMKEGNLNSTIKSLLPLIQADAFRQGYEVHAELGDIPDSLFDDKEIRQLILNLVRNGFEAMEPGGKVLIRTYQESSTIIAAVQDSGTGIPSHVMEKLGNPFVTTKEGGTGLGLPVCYRIADRHNARINVATGHEGTAFSIIFPCNESTISNSEH